MQDFSNINGKPRLRRLRVLRIDPTYALAVFAGQAQFTLDGMPADAEVVSVNSDWISNSIELLVYSAEFAVVQPMAEPPVFVIQFKVATTVKQ